MANNNRSNVLLVEILIAVLFFMLSATVLVQVFAGSRNMTVRSEVEARSITAAQNVAEALYGSEDVAATLDGLGFMMSHGTWTRDDGDYTLYVSGKVTPSGAGELWEGEVRAFYKTRDVQVTRAGDQELFSLPCTWYREVHHEA